MVNTILTISSFIICCVALGLNYFVLERQIRLNKDLIKEIERRANYEEYLNNQGVEHIKQINFLKNELHDCDKLLGSDRLSEFEKMFYNRDRY